jgi:diaminohydroxyphosphoribosylaminopyrimidine deaminase/5-amino-6-(5-phosphoribosylamino)uracil reductase
MTFSAADHAAMARALQLAAQAASNTTSPNPRVGCVLVRDGTTVGEGWHQARAGEAHAEVHALRQAGAAARGATAYVTLEPCSHFGRTPPCADALIAAGVARVVAAMEDPNPLVAGRGSPACALPASPPRTACSPRRRELNIGFVSRMTRGRPWVRLKVAGHARRQDALDNGVSQWITGPEARRDGHRWRARACAILTGIGTVKARTIRNSACATCPANASRCASWSTRDWRCRRRPASCRANPS